MTKRKPLCPRTLRWAARELGGYVAEWSREAWEWRTGHPENDDVVVDYASGLRSAESDAIELLSALHETARREAQRAKVSHPAKKPRARRAG